MPSKNENNKILAECAKVFKLGYCPDFFFLGCVKDGTEEVEVKLEKGKDRLNVVKLVPQDAFIFEVKSSDPTKKEAYTKNQLSALTSLSNLKNVHFYVLYIPLNLRDTFPLETYSLI